MRGILIQSQFASSIIRGTKDIEYHDYKLPNNYIDTSIYLLSESRVYGIIQLTESRSDEDGYEYSIKVIESWLMKPKYNHPNGAILYVKEVKGITEYPKSDLK